MTETTEVRKWTLRKADGSHFGPVPLGVLKQWASDGRIAPEDEISQDGSHWVRAANLPALEMRWEVILPDGSTYGPLNIMAIGELLLDGSVSADDRVRESGRDKGLPVIPELIRAYRLERERLHAELEEERSAWQTLLENERRAARQRESGLEEKLRQSRRLLKGLSEKLERIEAGVRSVEELRKRVAGLEKENRRLRELVERAGKHRGAEKARVGEAAGEAPEAARKARGTAGGAGSAKRAAHKTIGRGGPGIRLSSDDIR
ncbi:MAG TPA: hypothetical protein EYP62_02650 [Kiritimatiellae bacterium]|nr:hypothetical protein [Kiritimatiellia bacterium]